jgi:hypothetical protein
MQKTIASKLVRNKLTEMAALIGHSTSEIFPKQSSISLEKGDLGNFLNLPYYNRNKSVRYASKKMQHQQHWKSFLKYMISMCGRYRFHRLEPEVEKVSRMVHHAYRLCAVRDFHRNTKQWTI